MKTKAARNKTIDISIEEGLQYSERLIRAIPPECPLSFVTDKTLLGDCFSILPSLPKRSIDLLIVDPPYNLTKNYHGKQFKKVSDETYEEFTESWIAAVRPLLKDTASIYVCCDWQSSPIIGLTLKKHFKLQNRITWQREKGRGAKQNWKNGMEDIWFATVSNQYTFNADAVKIRRKVIAPYRVNGQPKDWEDTPEGKFRNTYPSNFWDDISIPYWSMPENTAHPTQKPEKLLAKLILASSNNGDLILDPFAGSGSTAVTAKKLDRHYIGIEQNEQYCIWAEKRLEMAETDSTIQGYKKGIFWERNSRPE